MVLTDCLLLDTTSLGSLGNTQTILRPTVEPMTVAGLKVRVN